ncbi:MAG TPA: c-type cytochrome domain-containing protein [Cyclobacteriaceae bacterium]|nr:c-type cytochrome domain-containing protein [Cyclobacteriaceae bacterium]
MDQFLDFTGRFHPLFVHLPIGILLVAIVFVWVNELGRVIVSSEVIRLTLAIGTLSAILSVVTGLLLADSGDYNVDTVGAHKYAGITLAIASIGLLLMSGALLKWGSLVVMILLVWTGHLGGTITHGEGYLFASADSDNIESVDLAKLDLYNAVFYKDAVEPILAARCYSCHGELKQKGGLRLDNAEMIEKGGKNGKVVAAGNPEESELVKRIDLPLDDEDHMPPKEKKQLNDQEKKLISLWIASGADFSKKISELVDEKKISELRMAGDESGGVQLPDVEVPEPDETLIASLVEKGVAITPVARGSFFLQVNFVSVPNEAATLLEQLRPVARNVVSLKLNDTNIEQVSLRDFVNVTSLNLSGTGISDVTMDEIVKGTSLVSLNISGTGVTNAGVNKLKLCESLRYLNVYNTKIDSIDLPGVTIERGNYHVPTLQTDTMVVK